MIFPPIQSLLLGIPIITSIYGIGCGLHHGIKFCSEQKTLFKDDKPRFLIEKGLSLSIYYACGVTTGFCIPIFLLIDNIRH